MVDVRRWFGWSRECCDLRISDPREESFGYRAPSLRGFPQPFQPFGKDRRLKLVQPAVHSLLRMMIPFTLTVIPNPAGALRQFLSVGNYGTSITDGTEVL